MIDSGSHISCYGCGVCEVICPKKIIKLKYSNEGFLVPYIEDKSKCINCDICAKYCINLESRKKSTRYIV